MAPSIRRSPRPATIAREERTGRSLLITVYKFGAVGESPDMSPFVIKVETWLRMAGIPYEGAIGTKAHMPKGKLPTIRDDGKIIADSSAIVRHLERKHGDPLGDASRTPYERAVATAMQAVFETHLYFVGFHIRWAMPDNWERFKPLLCEYVVQTTPPAFRRLVPAAAPLVLRGVRAQMLHHLRGQGTGRHTHEEIIAMGVEGWRTVSDFLGDKPFMLGDTPSGLDAVAYGFVETATAPPFESPVRDFVNAQGNLAAYRERMRQRYWIR